MAVRARKIFSTVSRLLAAAPTLLLAAMVVQAVHLRLVLGHWPVVYLDNPRSLALSAHEGVVMLLVWLSMIGLVGAPFAALFSSDRRVREVLGVVALYLVGVVVLIAAVRVDPTGYFEWFFD